jgi:hypothetical protein
MYYFSSDGTRGYRLLIAGSGDQCLLDAAAAGIWDCVAVKSSALRMASEVRANSLSA